MRRNRFVRVRRYDQWARAATGGFVKHDGRLCFASWVNPFYQRDLRMQSWRRPL